MADPGRRIHRKLDDFPSDIKAAVDEMLADPQATYTEIAEHVTAMGHPISRTSIYRYAATVGVDRTRLQKITEQTRRLVQSLQDNQTKLSLHRPCQC